MYTIFIINNVGNYEQNTTREEVQKCEKFFPTSFSYIFYYVNKYKYFLS